MNAGEAHRYASEALNSHRRPEPGQLVVAALYCLASAMGLLALLVLCNCGTTTVQKLAAANEAAAGLTKVVGPLMNANCNDKAKACFAAKESPCKALVKCTALRRGYYDAINAVHIAVASAAALSVIGKGDQLGAVLSVALKALERARAMATAAGFL